MITMGGHALPSVPFRSLPFPRLPPMIRSILSALAALAVAILAVLIAIGRIADTPRDTAHRLRASGMSQAAIAAALGCSRHRVRKLLA